MSAGGDGQRGRVGDRIARDLRARIDAGEFKPGDKLPSQTELSAEYEVAKMTAYQAINTLRAEGLVVTRQGSGVFVADQPQEIGLLSVVADAWASGHLDVDVWAPNARLLASALREPIARVISKLGAPPAGAIRLLAPGDPPDDYPFLRLRDDLAELTTPTLERRATGPASQFGFFLINGKDLFIGLSSEDHASLPPEVLAETLLHADASDTAGISQINSVKAWFTQAWEQAAPR